MLVEEALYKVKTYFKCLRRLEKYEVITHV